MHVSVHGSLEQKALKEIKKVLLVTLKAEIRVGLSVSSTFCFNGSQNKNLTKMAPAKLNALRKNCLDYVAQRKPLNLN